MLDGRERPEGGRPGRIDGLVEGLVDHDLVREMMEENARDHQDQRALKSLKNLLEERGGFGNRDQRGWKPLDPTRERLLSTWVKTF